MQWGLQDILWEGETSKTSVTKTNTGSFFYTGRVR